MCKGKKSTKNTGSDRGSHGLGRGADAPAKAARIPILSAREGQGVPMYWDHGELNLLKGVVSQQSSTRNGRLRYRRVLKNLHFDKSLGQFVERRLQKKNRLRTRFKVDVENYNLLRSAITEKQLQVPLQKGAEVEAVSVGDMGTSVTCCGGRIMQDLGWKVS